MKIDRPRDLTSYLTALQAEGRIVFTAHDVLQTLGIGHGAFLDAAERLQHRRLLLKLRSGFYVAVPPQYLSWGAPPPPWYIDDLMRHEGHPYYVALLKAAELHGATHQAVMEFQVVTNKRLPQIRAGRSLITFHFRKNMDGVNAGIADYKTDTGRMKVSSVDLTALDLFRYPHASAGLDNVATILSDLAPKIDPEKLASLSKSFERPVVQRLGYMLEYLGHADRARLMWTHLSDRPLHSVKLITKDPDNLAGSTVPNLNDRWRVIITRNPEKDE